MSTLGSALPAPLPTSTPVPEPKDILKHPSIDERKAKLSAGIKDQTFLDIDPGVFDSELLKLRIYSKLDPKHPEKPPIYQHGNIVTGSYSGTQAAVTHLYNRIERR